MNEYKAMQHAEKNSCGYYHCPECHELLSYVYDYYYDFTYHLQCPEDREHCHKVIEELKNCTVEYIKSRYEQAHLYRCYKCDFILHYDEKNKCLVCPVDIKHMRPVQMNQEEASKRGYKLFDKFDYEAKSVFFKRRTNPKITELMP